MPYLAQILNNRTNVLWINFVFLPMAFLVPLRVKFLKEQIIHIYINLIPYKGVTLTFFKGNGAKWGRLKLYLKRVQLYSNSEVISMSRAWNNFS